MDVSVLKIKVSSQTLNLLKHIIQDFFFLALTSYNKLKSSARRTEEIKQQWMEKSGCVWNVLPPCFMLFLYLNVEGS